MPRKHSPATRKRTKRQMEQAVVNLVRVVGGVVLGQAVADREADELQELVDSDASEPHPIDTMVIHPSKLAVQVRERFQYLYDTCGGADAESHSDWFPGLRRAVADVKELDEDPEALAAYAYLTGVADAMDLGMFGMLDAVLGSAW